jgi:hypothetical protein
MRSGGRSSITFQFRQSLLWVGLVLLFVLTPVAALADEIRVESLQANLLEGAYQVEARIVYEFSEEALEALENGVPLTLELHMQLRREGAWIWETDLVDARLRYQVRYHALGGLYQVRNLQSDSQQNFATREAALEALGQVSGTPIIEADRLTAGESYRLSLRSTLDIEALPLPLRPMAYLSPAWSLSSEWKTWRLRP